MEQVSSKLKDSFNKFKSVFNWSNPMQAIKIEKVIVSTAFGRVQRDKNRVELINDRLKKITGQSPVPCLAKKSIASFKLREGNKIGYKVTLRGEVMFNFLDRLIHIALPRSRDFRGIPRSSVDEIGNITIGIKEHTIFPETSDEEVSNIFGLSVVVVTTAKNKQDGLRFFEGLGFPIVKENK